MNHEQIQRAANQIESAVDNMQRIAGNLDESISRLVPLLGEGYGNNIERLIEALEKNKEESAEDLTNEVYLKLKRRYNPFDFAFILKKVLPQSPHFFILSYL